MTETLFLPFNLIYLVAIGAIGLLVLVVLHPHRRPVTLTRQQVEAMMPVPPEVAADAATPARRLDAFRGWVLLAVVLIAYPLGRSLVTQGFGATWTINSYNMVFLVAALLVHGRPSAFLHAVRNGTSTAAGVILQFPFYGGIFGVLNNTELSAWIGSWFVKLATTGTYPLLVYLCSAVMNLFVPSAGSKWLIEAPFLIPAGQELGVSLSTIVLAYAYGDSTTNLIQPFWALPLLAVTRLRFGDILGYTLIVTVVCLLVNIGVMLFIPTTL